MFNEVFHEAQENECHGKEWKELKKREDERACKEKVGCEDERVMKLDRARLAVLHKRRMRHTTKGKWPPVTQ